MERFYNVLEFNGVFGYVNGEYTTRKMSLEEFLKGKSHYEIPDTKRLFNSPHADFELKQRTMDMIREEVENGRSIFPITVDCDIDVVKNHLKLGMKVWLMKCSNYREFKKDYTVGA